MAGALLIIAGIAGAAFWWALPTARQAGVKTEARRFVPHITLGRFRPPGAEETMRLERAVVEQAGFRAGPLPVRDIVLFESTRLRDAARYEVLARYPLR